MKLLIPYLYKRYDDDAFAIADKITEWSKGVKKRSQAGVLYDLAMFKEKLCDIIDDGLLETIDPDDQLAFYNAVRVVEDRETYAYKFKYSKRYQCKKCHGECEVDMVQTRRFDEPATKVITCINCGFRRTES